MDPWSLMRMARLFRSFHSSIDLFSPYYSRSRTIFTFVCLLSLKRLVTTVLTADKKDIGLQASIGPAMVNILANSRKATFSFRRLKDLVCLYSSFIRFLKDARTESTAFGSSVGALRNRSPQSSTFFFPHSTAFFTFWHFVGCHIGGGSACGISVSNSVLGAWLALLAVLGAGKGLGLGFPLGWGTVGTRGVADSRFDLIRACLFSSRVSYHIYYPYIFKSLFFTLFWMKKVYRLSYHGFLKVCNCQLFRAMHEFFGLTFVFALAKVPACRSKADPQIFSTAVYAFVISSYTRG